MPIVLGLPGALAIDPSVKRHLSRLVIALRNGVRYLLEV
jgi:hypothetical protein